MAESLPLSWSTLGLLKSEMPLLEDLVTGRQKSVRRLRPVWTLIMLVNDRNFPELVPMICSKCSLIGDDYWLIEMLWSVTECTREVGDPDPTDPG